jgi:uncharacterized protein (TIGR02271 family)
VLPSFQPADSTEEDIMPTQRSTVVAVFNSRDEAERAADELQRAGFGRDQIGVVARDASGKGHAQGREGGDTYAEEGAAAGAAAGAGVAALASLGMSFGVIPLIGPILAVGPLAAALLSAVGGAAAGGLAGGLIGWGVPEEEAKYYEGEVKAGRYLVTVKADGRYDEAWRILHRCGGYNRETASHTGAAGTMAGEQRVQLHEEQLHARKQPVQTGEVKVRKEVTTEHQSIDVPVQREEVVIERHPATGRTTSGCELRPGEEVRIPVKEEQVHVEKTPVVKEEVKISKRTVQDTEHVSGTVRKEEVKVEQEGDVKVHGDVKNPRKRQ